MKLDGKIAEDALKNPAAYKAFLLIGDDAGLIRSRATKAVRAVFGGAEDPFAFAELSGDTAQPGDILAETDALGLMTGRRVVRVREAKDSFALAVEAFLKGPSEALLILEGEGLATKSPLVKIVEQSPKAGLIRCYQTVGQDTARAFAVLLAGYGKTADKEVLDFAAGRLGSDFMMMRQEAEKLCLYVGEQSRITYEDIEACLGEEGRSSAEEAFYLAALGESSGALKAAELALADGTNAVGLLRIGELHFLKLARVYAAMAEGLSRAEAINGLKPPVFFKKRPFFERSVALWSAERVHTALAALFKAELMAKQNKIAPDLVACHVLLYLAKSALRQSGARRSS